MNSKMKTRLSLFPAPTATVNAWAKNPPIWYGVPTPNTGSWTSQEIEITIASALDLLAQPGVPLLDLMKFTYHCIWLFRDMCYPGKQCLDQDLNKGMVAVLYQLINNIIDAGFRASMAHIGLDLSTARYEPFVTLEIYPAP